MGKVMKLFGGNISYFLLTLLSFGILSVPAHAAEIIHKYHSHIEVEQNGDIIVTETIQVTAEGNKIKRGIYRDLPTFRRTFLGGRLPTEYNILSVQRDGVTERHHTEKRDDGFLRIYFGDSSYYLTKGQKYTYEFRYQVPSQVFFYKDVDELNWNAIGTGWDFPIMSGSAEIVFNGAPIEKFAAYTGKALSKDKDYTSTLEQGRLLINVTRPLGPGEGLTVAVAWPKGYIAENPRMTGMSFFFAQHPGLKILLAGLLVLAGYYRYAWARVGKDPKSRGLAPFYSPPEGISPAMAVYIQTMGNTTSQKCMTAAIVSLASKGYLEIEEAGKNKYWIRRVEETNSRRKISEDEQILYDAIGESMLVRSTNKSLISVASAHFSKLSKLCEKHYFYKNSKWWAAGMVPAIASLVAVALSGAVPGVFWVGALFLLVFGGVSLGVFIFAVKELFTAPVGKKIGSFFLILWSMGFSVGGFMGFYLAGSMASWLVIFMMMLILAVIIVMRPIMKAPTKKGQEVIDHINGLQYYMEAVEEKILKKFDPPEMSRELYEKFLPYAVALDVESKWADKFAMAMVGALAAKQTFDTSPRWYRSSSGSSSSSGGFSASAMVSNFSSTLSAASTPASSSGSSGGGSSGGGGGGGGGGGW